ncbi:MAG: 3-oxoacyl-ACP synthase III family protein [Syntrophales bacterium]
MIKAQFESMGVYLPERVVSTQELIDRMETKPVFDLESLTGIKDRRWRSDAEDSYTIAVAAAKACLKKSCYGADDLDVIICSSISHFKDGCVNLWMKPGMGKFLAKSLGLRPTAMSFDITNACAGMLTGVHVLNSMIKSGAIKTGMVVSGECITPIAETALKEIRHPIDSQFASLTVGDSGAALIMDAAADEYGGIELSEFFTIAEFADYCVAMPSNENPGMAMYAKSMEIHHETIQRLPQLADFVMQKHGFSGKDVDYVIPHQTSVRAIHQALDLCARNLDALPEALISLDKFGNTASTSHFVVLHEHLAEKRLKRNPRILFLALASGIAVGFVLATIGKLEACYGYHH